VEENQKNYFLFYNFIGESKGKTIYALLKLELLKNSPPC
jgi:hypothetical protein